MERACLDCGDALVKKSGRGRWPKRCSACQAERESRRSRKSGQHRVLGIRECGWCGREYEYRQGNMGKYCSVPCSAAGNSKVRSCEISPWRAYDYLIRSLRCERGKLPRVRGFVCKPCKQCGALIFNQSGRFCSDQCSDAARICSVEDCQAAVSGRGWCRLHYERWLRHGDPLIASKPLAGCGTTGKYRAGCRCDRCCNARRAYIRELRSSRPVLPDDDPRHGTYTGYREWECRCDRCVDAWRDARRAGKRLRRVQERAEREPYRDSKIFERDRWRCGICGKRIGKGYKHPHPRSASIDHMVPLSLGGADAPANVQAAHLECNVAKGNRGGNEQLALIG